MSRYIFVWVSLGCPEEWSTTETALLTYKDMPSLLGGLIMTARRKEAYKCMPKIQIVSLSLASMEECLVLFLVEER